jgi:hypothetical protein
LQQLVERTRLIGLISYPCKCGRDGSGPPLVEQATGREDACVV